MNTNSGVLYFACLLSIHDLAWHTYQSVQIKLLNLKLNGSFLLVYNTSALTV